MKRSFPNEFENLALENCLVLLSQGRNNYDHQHAMDNPTRVFECKTCNRRFASFQALGGHRASHKKPKLIDGDTRSMENQQPIKPKTHECSICGVEFAIGQALGGHMRRHKTGLSSQETVTTPVVKKSTSRSVLCLDLNLTPLENDLEWFKLGKTAPAIIDCFF